jgi:hypothetical protein
LAERYTQNLAEKEVLLPHPDTLPAHHELPDQPAMITSLFAMKLDKQPLTLHLI